MNDIALITLYCIVDDFIKASSCLKNNLTQKRPCLKIKT